MGIGGMWVCGLVDSLSFMGERVGRDSPVKFSKFIIVSMGSRTNLGDFVLWFAFGRSQWFKIFYCTKLRVTTA